MPRRLIIVLLAVAIAVAVAAVVLALGLSTPAGANALKRVMQWLEHASLMLIAVVLLLALTISAGIAATVVGIRSRRGRIRPPKRQQPDE